MISPELVDWLEGKIHSGILPDSARHVGGGCIHESMLVDLIDGRSIFLKQNTPDQLPVFEAEKASLELLRTAGAIRVPAPLASGVIGGRACLAMEGLPLTSSSESTGGAELGAKIAKLHQTLSPHGKFGAPFDNFIGATPQSNRWSEDWADFFVNRRLVPQFRLAEKRGRRFENEERVCTIIHAHLRPLEINPSLVHGDLWNGNVGLLSDGEPAIFDPATYFGDPETDIAFTRMFGGFSPSFYVAYRAVHPAPEPGREMIYNLYHLLNHWNLFGGSYGMSAEVSMQSILKSH